MKFNTVKEYVEYVLKETPETRDNYNLLVIETLRTMGLNIKVNETIIKTMPSIETITRVCREIQNKEDRLVPDEHTDRARKKKKKEYEEHFSSKPRSYDTMKNSWMSA